MVIMLPKVTITINIIQHLKTRLLLWLWEYSIENDFDIDIECEFDSEYCIHNVNLTMNIVNTFDAY